MEPGEEVPAVPYHFEPPDEEPVETTDGDAWSPAQGTRRALAVGALWALVLSVLLGGVAWVAPYVVLGGLLRAFLALLVTWILLAGMQRAAGFTGWTITGPAVAFAALVLLSNHLVFALHGVPSREGWMSGWEFCAPSALLTLNLTVPIGIGGAALLCHRGGSDLQTLLDILRQRVGRWG